MEQNKKQERPPQRRGGRNPRDRKGRDQGEVQEFEQAIIELARVTRVMAGGKRMRFRACVVVGDRKGRVGYGLAKGQDVSMAIAKASTQAKKNVITVPIVDKRTIPHQITVKYKAARVFLKPAKEGTGMKAGGALRQVLDLAGVVDIVSKIHGSKNKINNVRATFKALTMFAPAKPQNRKNTSTQKQN